MFDVLLIGIWTILDNPRCIRKLIPLASLQSSLVIIYGLLEPLVVVVVFITKLLPTYLIPESASSHTVRSNLPSSANTFKTHPDGTSCILFNYMLFFSEWECGPARLSICINIACIISDQQILKWFFSFK